MKSLFLVCLILWFTLLTVPCRAQELAGRWKGTWSTYSQGEKRPHHGTLRVHLRSQGNGTYQGTFAGRFAVVIPYFYRASVTQYGDSLISTKRLGPFGEYRMELHHQPGSLDGHWSAGGKAGGIRLSK